MKLRRTSIAFLIAACATLSTTAWAGNGQNLLQYVPQNSYLVMSVDVAQMWNTPFYQTIWTMATADPEVQGPLSQLQAQAGFNPAADLHTILIALSPTSDDHFVMLVEGNFNPEQLGAFITAQAGPEIATTQYQGQLVYFDPTELEADRTQFSFINNNLAVIGTTTESNAVLDIVGGMGANIMANPELSSILAAADMSGMFWFAGLTTPEMQAEMVGSPMAGMKSMRGTASLAGGLNMSAVITNNTDVEAAGMAQFINGSLQEARANPEMAQMGLGGIFDMITVANVGADVTINVAIPEQTVNQVMGIITALVAAQQMAAQEQMMMEPAPAQEPSGEPAPTPIAP